MRHILFSDVDPSVAEMSWNGAEQLLQAAKDHGITVCFANPGPFRVYDFTKVIEQRVCSIWSDSFVFCRDIRDALCVSDGLGKRDTGHSGST